MDQHPSAVWTREVVSLDDPELSVIARSMIAARRALHGPLPSGLIHDPALDLLLNLFVAHLAHRSTTAEELTGSTTVAASIADRWIDALAQAGLLARMDTEVRLTDAGRAAVTETLRAVARSQWHLDDSA